MCQFNFIPVPLLDKNYIKISTFHMFTLLYGQHKVSVKLTGTCLTEAPAHIFMKMCFILSPLIENDMQDKMSNLINMINIFRTYGFVKSVC
jgi:hypothetical protein